jgi:hypothetical protein
MRRHPGKGVASRPPRATIFIVAIALDQIPDIVMI